jgi:hypothetical protein
MGLQWRETFIILLIYEALLLAWEEKEGEEK